jgi:AcrR family transcriptional regulator
MARPRSNISARILRAARDRFLVDGVDGASLRRIAREARTSVGMIYYYYPTKEKLFLAVVESGYGGLVEATREALGGEAPFADKLARLYQRLAHVSDDESIVMRLVIREMLTSSARRRVLAERFLHGHIPILLGAVLQAMQTGELVHADQPVAVGLSIGLLAFFPPLMRRLVVESGVPIPLPSADELARATSQIVLHGAAGANTPGRRGS